MRSDLPAEDAPVDERAVLTRQLEAIIAGAEAALLLIRGPIVPSEVCAHPAEQRRYLGAEMGDHRFVCLACRETVTPPAASPASKEA